MTAAFAVERRAQLSLAASPLVCHDQTVRGHEAQIEATLRKSKALPPTERVLATWSGYLIEFRAHRVIDPPARPTAVLAVTDTSMYVMSNAGLLHVTFDQLRGPHSPSRDVLRFSVSDPQDEPRVVTMAVRGAHAIARQLDEAIRNPRPVAPVHRPRAKQRPHAEYVD